MSLLLLKSLATVSANVVVCGDFNNWIDEACNLSRCSFFKIMSAFNITNKICINWSCSWLGFLWSWQWFCQNIGWRVFYCFLCTQAGNTWACTWDWSPQNKISFRLKKLPTGNINWLIHNLALKIHNSAYIIMNTNCALCLTLVFNDMFRWDHNSLCPLTEKGWDQRPCTMVQWSD